ncbi:MAG: type II toxin-antitoxin system HicB family antitoxin [Calditrichaeota bacterium]|nr:MAG: type II toxin-antitoxin system HicB family antitoxin [Calditrichota bacterium]
MKFKIRIERIREGLFIATCLNLPYCMVDGEDEREARQRLQAAIQAYVQSYRDRHEEIPYRNS